jgi:cyclic pyranopterin phosphate synthase
MPREISSIPMEEILTYEEITRVAEAAVSLGIVHFRLTGGEPLVRRGIAELVTMLRQVKGLHSLQLTTNGVALSEYAGKLKQAGLDGVNVSLDTIEEQEFAKVTGRPLLGQVLAGMEAAREAGLQVKLNAVEGQTKNPEGLLEYAMDNGLWLRFIEMMPIGYGRLYTEQNKQEEAGIFTWLCQCYGQPEELQESIGAGPARYYRFPGLPYPVGFITAMSRKFCSTCNRVRLTSTGWLKPCLCYEEGVDLRPLLRRGGDRTAISKCMQEVILRKPMEHCFRKVEEITENKSMIKIGG